MNGLLRERHRIPPEADPDFTIRNLSAVADVQAQTTKVMSLLLGAVASVSLIVGGIGIMNIMLVSVTERTREIGIRMAIGARRGDILLQFLMEAIIVSVIGCLIGVLLGVGGAIAGDHRDRNLCDRDWRLGAAGLRGGRRRRRVFRFLPGAQGRRAQAHRSAALSIADWRNPLVIQ